MTTPVAERAWRKVDCSGGLFDCWPWQGATVRGYGSIQGGPSERRTLIAHRVIYEAAIGPIPSGLTIDHLCRNRRCCNPAHMEPVTVRENTLRGRGITAMLKRQTTCKYGHPFTPDNTRLRRGGYRNCRTCDRLRDQSRGRSQLALAL